MAVRIENTNAENFGVLADETTITHGRISIGGAILTTRPLTNARTVAAGGQAEFEPGDIDIVIPASELQNAGLNALLALALDGANEMQIDVMTSAVNVVAAGGYAQQATAAWTRTEELDSVHLGQRLDLDQRKIADSDADDPGMPEIRRRIIATEKMLALVKQAEAGASQAGPDCAR